MKHSAKILIIFILIILGIYLVYSLVNADFIASTITLCSGGSCSPAPANSVNWTSGNSSIVSVNQSGSVTAVAAGITTVTAVFDPDGTGPILPLSAAVTVNVSSPLPNSPPSVSSVTIAQPDYCISGPAATVNWVYSDPDGDPQSAYQVQVDDIGSAWNLPLTIDTEKVLGSGTSFFTGDGVPPWFWQTTYKARVRVWDFNDAVSNWFESGSWTTPKHTYPIVNFTWLPLQPAGNQSVQFTDQTQFFDAGGVDQQAWNWLFGDSGSSTLQNPSHTYSTPGTYNVTETATDRDGYTCALTKPISIERSIPVWKEVSPR